MVFQNVVRPGVNGRTRALARARVRSGVRWWGILVVAGMVAYIAVCGYVYNLSHERHKLVMQRNQLREEYLLLRSQCEALRNPVRIQKQAKAYGMVLLTEPQAVAAMPVVVAQRN